jgi:Mrp family chromosome partitioning ATPase
MLCQTQASSLPTADARALAIRLGAITHKIAVVSGKGGVGKSSLAALLALLLADGGAAPSALLDLDLCGPSAARLLAVEGQPLAASEYGWLPPVSPVFDARVKVVSVAALLDSDRQAVVFRGPRKTALIVRMLKDTLWGRLRYLVLDTPPGTSDEHLTMVRALGAGLTGAVVVATPQQAALAAVRRQLTFCRKTRVPVLGIVANCSGYVCPHCDVTHALFAGDTAGDSVAALAAEWGVPFLGHVPLDPRLMAAFESRDYAALAGAPGFAAVQAVVAALRARLDSGGGGAVRL